MTLEGCVVRISDVIAYIGKDIDDAIRLGIITQKDIPKNITNILGNTNSQIINTIVTDIIENSLSKNYIKISENILKAMNNLMNFNYKNIYNKANTTQEIKKYKNIFNKLFNLYYKQITENQTQEHIFTLFLNNMNKTYQQETTSRKVIDYIAGMTDDFLISEYNYYFKQKDINKNS